MWLHDVAARLTDETDVVDGPCVGGGGDVDGDGDASGDGHLPCVVRS